MYYSESLGKEIFQIHCQKSLSFVRLHAVYRWSYHVTEFYFVLRRIYSDDANANNDYRAAGYTVELRDTGQYGFELPPDQVITQLSL